LEIRHAGETRQSNFMAGGPAASPIGAPTSGTAGVVITRRIGNRRSVVALQAGDGVRRVRFCPPFAELSACFRRGSRIIIWAVQHESDAHHIADRQ
jgi:hypothetical protein